MNATIDDFFNQTGQEQVLGSCILPEIPESTLHNYFSFTNFVILPLTILLGFWCFVSNLTVMIAVLRIGVKVRPGLLMLCCLTLTDVLCGGLVVPSQIAFWIKELIKGKVCPNFEELRNSLWIIPSVTCFFATTGILAVISFDRYIAVAKANSISLLWTTGGR